MLFQGWVSIIVISNSEKRNWNRIIFNRVERKNCWVEIGEKSEWKNEFLTWKISQRINLKTRGIRKLF